MTTEAVNPAHIRNISELPKIDPVYFEMWETWEDIKRGYYIGRQRKLKEHSAAEPIPESWGNYPYIWRKGESWIFTVQSEYWTRTDLDHYFREFKADGYCRELFFGLNTPANVLKAAATGTHPVNLGYKPNTERLYK